MSKLIPFALAGVGATATSVGTTYLIKGTSKAAGASDKAANLSFTTLEQFKAGDKGECVKKQFENLDLTLDNNKDLSDTNKLTADYFSSGNSSGGCLMVNWERTDSTTADTNGKWRGNFRWLWSFKKGDKGFLMFTAANPSTTANSLDLEGGIYFLTKNSKDNKWTVDKYKELNSGGPKVNKTDLDNVFPKPGDALAGVKNKAYWGFISANTDLEKICSSSESSCPSAGGAEKRFRGYWSWSKDGDPKVDLNKWSSNIETWLPKLYETKDFKLAESLKTSTGTWTEHHLSQPS